MAVQMGFNSFIGFTEQSTTAEVAQTGPVEFVLVDSFNFKKDAPMVDLMELNGRPGVSRRIEGDITANGSFVKAMDTFNGIGLYKHLLTGQLTTSSPAGWLTAKRHNFLEGEEVLSGAALQFMVCPGGNSATSRNYFGGIVESYSLNVAPGNVPKETWNLKFFNHGAALNTAPAQAVTNVDPIGFNKCLLKLGATITACSAVSTMDCTLNITNQFAENRELGTNTVSKFVFENRVIEGNLNIKFQDMTQYNNYLNHTATALQISLDPNVSTSNTAHVIDILLPEVLFTGETPIVGGQGEIIQPLTFKAYYGSNAAYMAKIQVINTSATVPLAT